ncbi:MAG: exodeoxyribonuclease VII large subunit [Anaerolineae bacterium]|nr:exodeoxyribonuclease VII large subunit [Anaerolineae bacterium]
MKRWGVGELTRYIRQLFEIDYRLQDLEVEGEVSNWRAPGASGHVYFTLKDADAQLKCVMWRSDVLNQRSLPQDGDRVIARGHLSVYEAHGQYQLYCRLIQPAGTGDLAAQFEVLKERLQAEGLFAPERKRPLPERMNTIGVVTSPGAAAFQDVLNVLGRRYPLAQVILSPTLVQGDQAPPQIVAALQALNALPGVDVILVVRGGGSLEDLWCFNDERVARAIATSRVPVVSGVGHETDFTLTDFAADVRAPTPSAAAELVTPLTVDDLRGLLRDRRTRTFIMMESVLSSHRRSLQQLSAGLRLLSPLHQITALRQYIDGLTERAVRAVGADLHLRRERLAGTRRALDAMNPANILARGYAVVRDKDGEVLRRAAEVPPGSRIVIRLHEGQLWATVEQQEENNV